MTNFSSSGDTNKIVVMNVVYKPDSRGRKLQRIFEDLERRHDVIIAFNSIAQHLDGDDDDDHVTRETATIITESRVIRLLNDIESCRATICTPVRPIAGHKEDTFMILMNEFRTKETRLNPVDVEKDLEEKFECMVKVGLISRRDIEARIFLKDSSWYGFIHASQSLSSYEYVIIYTWLLNLCWILPGIEPMIPINIRYAKMNMNSR